VIGKVASETPPSKDVFRQMLQALLADRFSLKIHHVQKDLPVYNLTIDKSRPKLERSAGDTKFASRITMQGHYTLRMVNTLMTMEKLASILAANAGRPVFNKTGLDDAYDFTLEFVMPNVANNADAAAEGPSLFTALREQLGLRLEAATAFFDCVVIDHAERPSTN
jgi:uncharacterized protein (TIGR03435 family)